MNKTEVIKKIRTEIESQYKRIVGAAEEAASYATDPDSKAESKYDTRGLEASYLAAGQAAKADELSEDLRYFSGLELPEFESGDFIAHGALVTFELSSGHSVAYLLAGRSGGTTISYDGLEITILTPSSPLYQTLESRNVGDEMERPEGVISALC